MRSGLNRWYRALLKKHTAGTSQLKYTAVVAFYKYNRKPLVIPKFPVVTKDQYRGYKRLRRKEIQQLLQFTDNYRGKLLLMIGAESGLRVRALAELRLGCFIAREEEKDPVLASHWRDLEDAPLPVRIQLPRRFYLASNTKREGITFICADAVKVLVDSLKEREAKSERITAESPVFPVYDATIEVPGRGQLHTVFTEYHPVGSEVVTKQPRSDSTGTVRVLPVACKVVRITPAPASSSTLEHDMQQIREKSGLARLEKNAKLNNVLRLIGKLRKDLNRRSGR